MVMGAGWMPWAALGAALLSAAPRVLAAPLATTSDPSAADGPVSAPWCTERQRDQVLRCVGADGAPAWCVCVEREPGDFVHDGFYLRFGVAVGYSWGWGEVRSGPNAGQDLRRRGGALLLELQAGGTVLPGLVVGAHLGLGGGDANKTVDGEQVPDDIDASLGTLGIFATFYPVPVRGLYGQVLVGYASLQERDAERNELGDNMSGPTVTLGAGWEIFIGTEISMGLALRLQYARLTRDEPGREVHHLVLPSLALLYTYH